MAKLHAIGVSGCEFSQFRAARYPAVFSPDSARIAFESTRDGGLREIHVMQAGGSRVRALTTAR
jgi:Tol biopolymer transport system component